MFSENFIMKLTNLSGTLGKRNTLNTSLQGGDSNILQLSDKLKSCIKRNWTIIEENCRWKCGHISLLRQCIESSCAWFRGDVKNSMNHLPSPYCLSEKYFSDLVMGNCY